MTHGGGSETKAPRRETAGETKEFAEAYTMIKILTLILELLILSAVFFLGNRLWWNRYSGIKRGVWFILLGCAALIAISAGMAMPSPTRTVTVTALNTKNEASKEVTIYLEKVQVEGADLGLPELETGKWTEYSGRYCWFEPGDKRRAEDQTDSISFQIKAGTGTELFFLENCWRGNVLVQVDGKERVFDTYWDGGDKSRSEPFTLPAPGIIIVAKAVLTAVFGFVFALVALSFVLTLLLESGCKMAERMSGRLFQHGLFRKVAGFQFLFEELVKRDFKKKYKSTVLGMAWSVLSPLLTLLVMRLVFTQFFGNHVAHYTTYLFCGNLVFSYFNESTSQGMTSLIGNAGIFTKVNVPKYLFLFSKNVQTLINFGLTLCVFFIFCVLDNIIFTWKLVCLLYPIFMLVLFNIGVGLILSALFVFFRDIQYLWSIFTLLLMYMSAIFYTVDGYEPMARNLFLLNPVYLFIRYFRKIVIETTIPSVWFHLLMLVDVAIVLAIGCWMYKKYNHKFLYYV